MMPRRVCIVCSKRNEGVFLSLRSALFAQGGGETNSIAIETLLFPQSQKCPKENKNVAKFERHEQNIEYETQPAPSTEKDHRKKSKSVNLQKEYETPGERRISF